MATTRTLVSIAAAAVIALAAVVIISNSPAGGPRTALAGPCAADPLLFEFLGIPPRDPLLLVRLFGETGRRYIDIMEVVTDPAILPPGKDPVTIEVFEIAGHPGIATEFKPAQSNGSFDPLLFTFIGPDVPAGVYDYEIEVYCHGRITTIPYTIFVNTCPVPFRAGFQISGLSGTPTPTWQPFPDTCEEPTATPTAPPPPPTPSPTAPPVPTPTPTAAPGQQVTWADNNCKDGVNPVDALLVLRGDAGLPTDTGACPDMGANIDVQNASPHIWGNVDCKDGMTPVDSLKILRFDAGLGVTQEQPCPAMGSNVQVTDNLPDVLLARRY